MVYTPPPCRMRVVQQPKQRKTNRDSLSPVRDGSKIRPQQSPIRQLFCLEKEGASSPGKGGGYSHTTMPQQDTYIHGLLFAYIPNVPPLSPPYPLGFDSLSRIPTSKRTRSITNSPYKEMLEYNRCSRSVHLPTSIYRGFVRHKEGRCTPPRLQPPPSFPLPMTHTGYTIGDVSCIHSRKCGLWCQVD